MSRALTPDQAAAKLSEIDTLIACRSALLQCALMRGQRAQRDALVKELQGLHVEFRSLQRIAIDGSLVYFVGTSSRVKIGTTRNLKERLRTLQLMSPKPISLLAAMPGDADVERELHSRFADYRMHGEWFRLAGDLKRYVTQVRRRRYE